MFLISNFSGWWLSRTQRGRLDDYRKVKNAGRLSFATQDKPALRGLRALANFANCDRIVGHP